MGQKANPIGNRLGIIKGWESNWYGGREFAEKLVGDDDRTGRATAGRRPARSWQTDRSAGR